MHGVTACFVYIGVDKLNERSLSRDPDAIAVYSVSDSQEPTLVYEFPYAGTEGRIDDAFFLPIDDSQDEQLFVIHSMEKPRSWESVSDAYDVNVIRRQGAGIIQDQKLSRFFRWGTDLVSLHGEPDYIYPYKDRKAVTRAVNSKLFAAINASTPIAGTIQKKAFLYAGDTEPGLQDPKKMYLIRGDQILLEDSVAGWCKIFYEGKLAKITRWTQCKSIKF